MFGFLNVYKPKGMTSHDVVAVLRKVSKIKQIGHTGTLDPFAEGVLPICIGKATRLIEYLKDDKAYIGTIQFGKSTTTYDREGEIVHTSDKLVTSEDVSSATEEFCGEIEQYPPIYSAIKVKGKKLYEYARNNESVEIQPRKVTISEIKLLNFNYEKQEAELYISCSKGTYIRSIANDLGEKLGAYGYLKALKRVKAGKFTIDSSIELRFLDTVEEIEKHLIYPVEYLEYPNFEINESEKIDVSNGKQININAQNGTVVLTHKNELCSIGNVSNGTFTCHKVFV